MLEIYSFKQAINNYITKIEKDIKDNQEEYDKCINYINKIILNASEHGHSIILIRIIIKNKILNECIYYKLCKAGYTVTCGYDSEFDINEFNISWRL